MDLGELIRTHKGARTFEQLERDCGGYPTRQRLQQLTAKTPLNFPDPRTIRCIATGLGVTEATVVLAAAEGLGLDVREGGSRLLSHLPAGADDLSEDQLRAIGDLVRAFAEPRPSVALAARDQDVQGRPLRSRGRRARAAQDRESTAPDAEG